MTHFYIHTFGCQMNVYDSEKVSNILIERGWTPSSSADSADLVIVNTCSVREKPLEKVFSFVGRHLHRKEDGCRIFVMGCVAQQLGEEIIKRAPAVDGVFGPGAEHLIPDVVEKGIFPFVSNDADLLERRELFPVTSQSHLFNQLSANVTIMHGCNNFCTYCIVPYVRGREISRSAAIIVDEIKGLTRRGVKEITLLGQNVNSYRDNDCNFVDLLYKIAEECEVERLRFVTSHPKDFTPGLAQAFRDIDILMPYLHLPAQSGSDRILKIMNRKYTVSEYREKIETARRFLPDLSLSSDFIVGFPGETEEDFENTVELVREIGYDTIFAFCYSPRPLTKAAEMETTLSEEEKLRRLNHLLDIQRERMRDVRSRFQGRKVKVLIDGKSPKGNSLMGRNEHNLIVHATGCTGNEIGSIIEVSVSEVLENTLRGKKI